MADPKTTDTPGGDQGEGKADKSISPVRISARINDRKVLIQFDKSIMYFTMDAKDAISFGTAIAKLGRVIHAELN